MAQRLALPIRIAGNGRLAALTQDSDVEIAQSTALLASTRPGERRALLDYGIPDPLFGGVDVPEIAAAVAEWEERADPAVIEEVALSIVEQRTEIRPTEQLDAQEV